MERCKEKIDENGYKMGRGDGKEDCAPTGKFKVYCKRNDNKVQIDLNDWLKNKTITTEQPSTSPPPTSPPPTQPIDATCPPLNCNSEDSKTKMKDYYKKTWSTLSNDNYNISNIIDSALIDNNKCEVSYSYNSSKNDNGNDYRHFTFSNDENCNWEVNLMDKPPTVTHLGTTV